MNATTQDTSGTVRALSTIQHDGRDYRPGELVQGLTEEQRHELIECGAACAVDDLAPLAAKLPPRPFRGRNHGMQARYVAEPDLADWLELGTSLLRARKGMPSAELSDEQAALLAKRWDETRGDPQVRMELWHATDAELQEALAAARREVARPRD